MYVHVDWRLTEVKIPVADKRHRISPIACLKLGVGKLKKANTFIKNGKGTKRSSMAVDIKGNQPENFTSGPDTEEISAPSEDDVGTNGRDGIISSSPTAMDNSKGKALVDKAMKILNWMPERCRYDPENPPNFTLAMNILLAFVCSLTTLRDPYFLRPS